MNQRLLRWTASILLCMAGHASAESTASPPSDTLVLGVVPQFPSIELQRRWAPVVRWLESGCHIHIRMDFTPSIPAFEDGFIQGRYDVAYMNPYHAVMAARAQGYEPMVRDGHSSLKGILVVKADSAVRNLQDLQGSTLAFPAPNAFGASLYIRALLEREYGLQIKPYYAKTHANSYRHVLRGEAAAAGGVSSTLAAEGADVNRQLRVLYETPPVAPHPLSAHPRVSADVRRCITELMIHSDHGDEVKGWLAGVQMPQPMRASYVRDYQPLEKLSLESYVVRTTP